MEKYICQLTTFIYQYYYEIAKKELGDEGSDTYERAYDYAYRTVADTALVSAELIGNKLVLLALDPAALLCLYKGVPELWNFVQQKMYEQFNLVITIGLFTDTIKNSIYDYTKPYLMNVYDQIHDDLLTWHEVFFE